MTTLDTIQALYVDPESGPYVEILGQDNCWGVDRDAKTYDGPGPVVAHPPCKPWGKLAWSWLAKNERDGLDRSDEKACGPRAVEQVRAFGGVLEHPDGSGLWSECALPEPRPLMDLRLMLFRPLEFTIVIDQCDFGFPARKRTRLFFAGIDPGSLPLMPPKGTPTMTIGTKREDRHGKKCLPKSMRHLTTPTLGRWLVAAARSAQ